MSTLTFFAKRPEIREAIWLWCALICVAKATSDQWLSIGSGEPFSDESIAAVMNVPAATVARWRNRLVKAGIIRVSKVDRRWIYEVWNPDFKEASATTKALQQFPASSALPN